MTWRKRIFDLFFASLLVIILGPIIVFLVLYIYLKQGRPLFYVAERMKTPTQPFGLIKFRTMTVVNDDQGGSGAPKSLRITPISARLRCTPFVRCPHRWSILKGGVSLCAKRTQLKA